MELSIHDVTGVQVNNIGKNERSDGSFYAVRSFVFEANGREAFEVTCFTGDFGTQEKADDCLSLTVQKKEKI